MWRQQTLSYGPLSHIADVERTPLASLEACQSNRARGAGSEHLRDSATGHSTASPCSAIDRHWQYTSDVYRSSSAFESQSLVPVRGRKSTGLSGLVGSRLSSHSKGHRR